MTSQDRWEELPATRLRPWLSSLLHSPHSAMGKRIWQDGGWPISYLAYADWLSAHVEEWTVTARGELVEVFAALHPHQSHRSRDAGSARRSDTTMLQLANGGGVHPARNVVGGDFLHLVRLGIRAANDPIVRDSLEVIDRVLKRDLPQGPGWRRYNHDGYGQKDDGSAFRRNGCWPLVADPDRRARPLRTGCRTRSAAIHRYDGEIRQSRRNDQRTGLGRRGFAGWQYETRSANRCSHATMLGARRISIARS